MPNETLFISQLLQQVGSGWLPAVMLVGMLLALLFKPERVQSWALFRLSCWLLAVSIIIMPVMNVLLGFMGGSATSFRSSGIMPEAFIFYTMYAISPILQGISMICGLLSMIPNGSRLPLVPPKHPLE
jgi:hypothetical protein